MFTLFKWWYFRLESQCVTAISFVKNEPELLDRWQLFLIEKELVALKLTIMPPLCNILQPDYFFSPIWVIIINIVALEMLKAKLPQCKWSRDWFPKSINDDQSWLSMTMTNHLGRFCLLLRFHYILPLIWNSDGSCCKITLFDKNLAAFKFSQFMFNKHPFSAFYHQLWKLWMRFSSA